MSDQEQHRISGKRKLSSAGSSPPRTKEKRDEPKPQSWDLSSNRRVAINHFKGNITLDIREYYNNKDGDLLPGKKGIALTMEQFGLLKILLPDIVEALEHEGVSFQNESGEKDANKGQDS